MTSHTALLTATGAPSALRASYDRAIAERRATHRERTAARLAEHTAASAALAAARHAGNMARGAVVDLDGPTPGAYTPPPTPMAERTGTVRYVRT